MPTALMPSATTIKPLTAMAVVLGTCHQLRATHQELQHFLGVWVHFNDLLVQGRDLGAEEAEMWFDKSPAATNASPCNCSGPSLLLVVGKGSSKCEPGGSWKQDEPGPQWHPTLLPKHHKATLQSSPTEGEDLISKSLEAQGLTTSTPRLLRGARVWSWQSAATCSVSPQGWNPTAMQSDLGCPPPGPEVFCSLMAEQLHWTFSGPQTSTTTCFLPQQAPAHQ